MTCRTYFTLTCRSKDNSTRTLISMKISIIQNESWLLGHHFWQAPVMSYLLGKTFLSNLYNQTSPRLKFSLLEIIWFCGTHIYFSKKNKWVEVIIIINMRVFLSYCSMFFSTKNGIGEERFLDSSPREAPCFTLDLKIHQENFLIDSYH